MADISEGRMRHLIGKPWSCWNLPECSTDNDLAKLREVYKPKEPDKPADHCNLLPSSLMHLYGSRPDIEFFSVTKCAGCRYFIKTQWLSHHFKRDGQNNMVCRKTELIVSGSKSLCKATTSLHEIRESTRTPFMEISTAQSSSSPTKSSSNYSSESSITSGKSPTRSKSSSSHKTESVVSTFSSSKSSKSGSHHQSSKSKSTSSSSTTTSSSSKSKSSSKSSSGTSSSWSTSKSGSSKSSHKSSPSPGTYTLSIPSDDTGQNESVESILFSNSTVGTKHTMHIIATSTATGKSKSGDTEYEQLKFYADSAEKKSKPSVIETDSNDSGHKLLNSSLHANADGSHFKIPSKSKSSSSSNTSSGSQAVTDSNKKSKSSHTQSKSSQDVSANKVVFRSSSSNLGSPKPPPVSSLPSSSEIKTKGESSSNSHGASETKEKSSSGHSKKKKKKKDKDEPRKVIPLKDRAFHPDHHCGVCLPDDSNPCTRSLTCKTHSIALRRAVAGRSHSFDSLLAAHKKARDEEKNAKAREYGDESKSKSKKSSSQTGTSAPADAIMISSAHAVGTGKGPPTAVSTPVKGNGTFLAPVAVPVLLPVQSISSRSVSSPNNIGSKAGTSHLQMHRNVSKTISNAKSSNKPVIVVEEQKDLPGLSLFDIAREPENNFVYVTSIKAPKAMTDFKTTDGKRGITALSEWNPLDRWSRKEKTQKKKHPKDLLVPICSHKILDPAFFNDAMNEVKYETAEIPNSNIRPTHSKAKSNMTGTADGLNHRNLKRKLACNVEYLSSPSSHKISRLVSPSKGFYDSMLFKSKESSNSGYETINWQNSKEPSSSVNLSRGDKSLKTLDYEVVINSIMTLLHDAKQTEVLNDYDSYRDRRK